LNADMSGQKMSEHGREPHRLVSSK